MPAGCSSAPSHPAPVASAGSWRVSVAGMDGQRGILRVGPSGGAIGLLYEPREDVVQSVAGSLDSDGRLYFVLGAETPRFHDPWFQETARTGSSLQGTWQSGSVSSDGKPYGEGHGTWSARRVADAAEPAPTLTPGLHEPVGVGDAPRLACRITDAAGRIERFEAPAKSVTGIAEGTEGRRGLSVAASDGKTAVSLSFTRADAAEPQPLDMTARDPRRYGTDASWSHGTQIALFFSEAVSTSRVRRALASAGVRGAAIQSIERTNGGTTIAIALAGEPSAQLREALLALPPADTASGAQSADAATYQAATGSSPGWWTLVSENAPQAGYTRFRGTETFAVAGSAVPVAHGDSYDFQPAHVSRLFCSVVVDVDLHPSQLTPAQQLENAAKNLR